MKIKLVLFVILSTLIKIFANPYSQGEMWIEVTNNGQSRGGATITIYDNHWQIVDIATTSYTPVEQDGNAFMYMEDEPVSNPNAAYVIGPLNYDSTYHFVIDNRYATIGIGSQVESPDEHLHFNGYTFSLDATHKVFTLVNQGDWNPKTVTVKNSFNSGNVKVDNVIKNHGYTTSFGTPSFPHTLEAINNQYNSAGYKQKFQNWTENISNDVVNISLKNLAVAVSAIHTANFLSQFNITFKNQHPGGEVGGDIKVDNEIWNSPKTLPKSEWISIKGEALNHTLNSIYYTFDHWSEEGSTQNPYFNFSPHSHKTYSAIFKGKPTNGYRNQTFNPIVIGQPIKVSWKQHPNTNVSHYKVYRKPKFGSEQLVQTFNRTGDTNYVYTYTDPIYIHTNNQSTTNLLYYDVRAYYAPDQRYSDADFKAVYGETGDAKKIGEIDASSIVIYEYGIESYPNPFNPTSTINYTIKEIGNVKITIYDALGRKVKELLNEIKTPGSYDIKFDGSKLSSGIYIYTMNVNEFYESKKMILTK